jgi:hypothetical protein
MCDLFKRTLEWTDHRSGALRGRPVVCALLAAVPLLAACVSKDFQTAPKKTPPAVAINQQAQQPPLVAVLHTVIYFHGPGSWKREAYWDEYVLSIVNQSATPLDIDSASLASSVIATQAPGSDPWALEKQSHKILKDQSLSRTIVAGAGVTVGTVALEAGVTTLAATAVATGSAAAVAGATVALVALPAFVVGSGIRRFTAPHEIQKEFNLRRLALPLQLKPGEMLQGSLFFPITPGPQHLDVNFRNGALSQTLTIDLAPLSSLHFNDSPSAAPAAAPAPR